MQELTQMVGPISPALFCWSSLVVTVAGLGAAFYFTNITAFAKKLRDRKEPTSGAGVGRDYRKS
jgi:hypothetical protein